MYVLIRPYRTMIIEKKIMNAYVRVILVPNYFLEATSIIISSHAELGSASIVSPKFRFRNEFGMTIFACEYSNN